jgi:hypothetical protein
LRRHQKAIKAGSVVHFVSAVYITLAAVKGSGGPMHPESKRLKMMVEFNSFHFWFI